MGTDHHLTVPEDRSALGPLIEAQEGHPISITMSDYSRLSLSKGWALIDKPGDAEGMIVRLSNSGSSHSFEMDEVVRINDLKSGEMIWETLRGQLVFDQHPPKVGVRIAAMIYLPVLIVSAFNEGLGWNLFGDWDGHVLGAVIVGGMLIAAFAPQVAEVR